MSWWYWIQKAISAGLRVAEVLYTGVTALGGNVNMAQWCGATSPKGVVSGCAQWGGVTVNHQIEDFVQFGGVTSEVGTVS